MKYPALVLFFVLAGYLEQMGFRSGHRPWKWVDIKDNIHDRLKILGWIIPSYHFPLLASWFLVCFLAGATWFFPIGATIQDWGYWRFHPTARLGEDSSVNSKLGGGYVYGNKESRNNWWLPRIYITAFLLSGAAYYAGV